MRLNWIVASLLFWALPNLAVAQSQVADKLPPANQVFESHIQALGGRAKLQSIQNIVQNGTMELSGPFGKLKLEFEEWSQGNKRRTTMTSGAVKISEGTDGSIFWRVNPQIGAKIVTGKEQAYMKSQAEMMPALSWNRFDGKITVDRSFQVGDKDCFQVRFVPRQGPRMLRFFDKETGRILQMVGESFSSTGAPATMTVIPSDYRKVEGVLIPFQQRTVTIDTATKEEFEILTTLKEIKFNQKLGPGTFDLPPEIKRLVKK